MIKLTLAVTAMAACAVSAAAQAADPAFAAFSMVCAAPAADFTAVKAAADSHGWAPSNMAADANMPGVVVSEQFTRATSVDKTGLTLSAWRGVKGPFHVSDCAVHVDKGEYPAALAAAKAWVASAPQATADNRAIFRFTDAAGTHKPLTPDDFNAAVGAAGLEILTISGTQDGVVLDLMMIKK